MLAIPLPEPGGSIDDLKRYANVRDEDDWKLLVVWMISSLRPRGPYPVLVIHGEQGTGKSTLSRVLRELLDANACPLRSEPRDKRDLAISAEHGWLQVFDNLSELKPWISDCLCRLCTGDGFSTRTLYTDQEEILFSAQRPVVINSIEELASRPDLLDRSVLLYLAPITDGERRSERVFKREFSAAKPKLFGAILDVLAGALGHLPYVTLDEKSRMADYCELGVAVEKTMAWPAGSFMRAYTKNRAAAAGLASEADILTGILVSFMEGKEEWDGSATELLEALGRAAGEKIEKSRAWPKGAPVLSGRLRRLVPSLRGLGIEVTFSRDTDSQRRRIIRILKHPTVLSEPSEPSDGQEAAESRPVLSPCDTTSRTAPDGSDGSSRNPDGNPDGASAAAEECSREAEEWRRKQQAWRSQFRTGNPGGGR